MENTVETSKPTEENVEENSAPIEPENKLDLSFGSFGGEGGETKKEDEPLPEYFKDEFKKADILKVSQSTASVRADLTAAESPIFRLSQ